ncbi:hypothetical protein [Nautilia sp. PV-1]|nr:hypothetical protein [Nautilia sp. PV-1]
MIYAITVGIALILPYAVLKTMEIYQVQKNKKKIWKADDYEFEII